MEFFTWVYTIDTVWSAYGDNTTLNAFIIELAIAAALYIASLVLGGIGLATMAKKQGIKGRWMAFLPILHTYYAGKLTTNTNFFGIKMKRSGLYAAISEAVIIAITVADLVLTVLFGAQLAQFVVETDMGPAYNFNGMPMGLQRVVIAQNALAIASSILSIFQLLFFFALYLGIFRKYATRNAMIFTVVSVLLPIRGIFLFAVRNNKPIDYDAYVKEQMARYARQQGYGQPYNQGGTYQPPRQDPFGGEFGGTQSGGNSDPFGGEFTGDGVPKQEDPFSDFSNSDENK